jgi:hypothetical protein
MMQHQKIEKYIIDLKWSFGNTDSLFGELFFYFLNCKILFWVVIATGLSTSFLI